MNSPLALLGRMVARRKAYAVDDFSLVRVTQEERHSTRDISLVRMGFTTTASDLFFGYTLSLFLSFWYALAVALIASAVISTNSILMGLIGTRERTSFALTTRFAFGRAGSRLPSLIIAISSTAFFGYIIGITVDVLPHDNPIVAAVECAALGVLYVLLTLLGFGRGLRRVNMVGVPIMIVLVLVADIVVLVRIGGFGPILDAVPSSAGARTVPVLIGLGIAKWMTGSSIAPDSLRFAKKYSTALVSTIAEFVGANFGFDLMGIILGLGLGSSDLGHAFGLVGLAWLAALAFIIQGFTIQTHNLYNVGLDISNVLRFSRTGATLIAGIVGTALGYYALNTGIVDSFLNFLGLVGYAIPAIPGVIICDYYLVRRMRYRGDIDDLEKVRWLGVLSYCTAVAISIYLGINGDVLWRSTPLIGFGVALVLFSPLIIRSWTHRSDPAAAVSPQPTAPEAE